LLEAKKNLELTRFIRQFNNLDLLIIDNDGSKLLFGIISDFYEKRSLIITTNLEFAHWNDIFADKKITAALLDRIIHHSHLLHFT
jgi:DNA replication protein DnaC